MFKKALVGARAMSPLAARGIGPLDASTGRARNGDGRSSTPDRRQAGPEACAVRVLYLHYAGPGFVPRYRQWLHVLNVVAPGQELEIEIVTMDEPGELALGMERADREAAYVIFDPVR